MLQVYILAGTTPSTDVTATMKTLSAKGPYYLPSRFPYAEDNTCNFHLTQRIILSGDVEANLGPKEANVHQESKQINTQCQSKLNGGLKICKWNISRLTDAKFEQLKHFLTSSCPQIDVLFFD